MSVKYSKNKNFFSNLMKNKLLLFGVLCAIGSLLFTPLATLGFIIGCILLIKRDLGGLGVIILSVFLGIIGLIVKLSGNGFF